MKHNDFMLKCLLLIIITLFSPLFADSTPNPYSCVIDPEFANTDLLYAPLTAWASAGSNAVIDSVFTINVLDIPDDVTYEFEGVDTSITEAQSGEGFDNSLTFNRLIAWIKDSAWLQGIHTQIYIPPGVYYFSDQIIMHSNISLKGAGSHLTELRFLIRADSTSTNMSETDCRKDAILISGDGVNPPQRKRNIGIEDLKITRDNGGLSPEEIKTKVGDHSNNGTPYPSYWGNNIAIRRATNCWVKGVESENTFRNHVTLEFAEHITVSGVYFYDAIDYGDGGYGYGVGIWNSSSNKVENSIFKHLRHGVHELTMVYFPGSVPKLLPAKLMAVYLDNSEVFDGNVGLVKQNKYQISDFHKSDR